MPEYIGKDGIRVVVFPQTAEEIAENERKWKEYLNSPYIQALRALAKQGECSDDVRGILKGK